MNVEAAGMIRIPDRSTGWSQTRRLRLKKEGLQKTAQTAMLVSKQSLSQEERSPQGEKAKNGNLQQRNKRAASFLFKSYSIIKAYRTYATRWTTEVAYHDCKQLLDFGKCQSIHFSAQIASFTLTMMQYNILCTVKRFEAYETIGALFREATTGTLELSASDRIWELILDTILEIAEMISADASELLSAIIDVNPKFHKFYQMYNLYAA